VISIRKINENISLGLLDLKAFSLQQNITVKREQEKAGTRFLLTSLLNTSNFELAYTEHNKPFLKDSSVHISISHSHDKLVIICNTVESTGIDIELVRDKVLSIRHKFLNELESDFVKTDVHKHLAIWAAKEAMYKAYGLKGVDFKEQMSVQNFEGDDLIGQLEKDGILHKYLLRKETIDAYVMVYILKQTE
jgi:phosphopantetheinyl transferase